MSDKGDELREQIRVAGELALIEDDKAVAEKELSNVGKWLETYALVDEHEIAKEMCRKFQINLSDAKKQLNIYPSEYTVNEKNVPDIVKDMRLYRRELKGDYREKMSKSIETLIFAYSDHLNKCIDSIYWIRKYKYPLNNMKYDENILKKINTIKDGNTRGKIIDSLCKFWEADLEVKNLSYGKDFASLNKQKKEAKKEFTNTVKSITNQSIRKNITEQINDYIIKSVCETPGISARELHEQMDIKLYKRASPQIISKVTDRINITNVEGKYYRFNLEIKKDLYAYTAAFIDSDGYITMDKKNNPRVGLVATGDRGKAFMIEMQKSLGVGKLHLDQKSPQNTRPVNRLNFYSQDDVRTLLTKCRPYFRMKGEQADTLLELVRIKKNYKKEEWAKDRVGELFKLMKWYNHKDHVGYDFSQYEIDIENISKLEDNNKMSAMDKLETIGMVV